jgi:hypothetical protein
VSNEVRYEIKRHGTKATEQQHTTLIKENKFRLGFLLSPSEKH